MRGCALADRAETNLAGGIKDTPQSSLPNRGRGQEAAPTNRGTNNALGEKFAWKHGSPWCHHWPDAFVRQDWGQVNVEVREAPRLS